MSRFILIPYLKRTFSNRDALNDRAIQLNDSRLIVIGDSFAQMGNFGWVRELEHSGYKILNLGSGGACPSQYMNTLHKVERQLKMNQVVIILLYLGNDFEDQVIWEETQSQNLYYAARKSYYFESNRLYWPYSEPPSNSVINILRRSEFSKMFLILFSGIRLKFNPEVSQNESVFQRYISIVVDPNLMRQQKHLSQFLENNVSMKQYVFKKNDRFFFILHHNKTAFEASPELGKAALHILTFMREISNRDNIWIFPILSREEIGAAFHQQRILRNAPFINEIKKVNSHVFDVNPEFEIENSHQDLYLPDGHWNSQGHILFSRILLRILNNNNLSPAIPLKN